MQPTPDQYILVIGTHPEIMDTLHRLIQKMEGFSCVCALTLKDALARASEHAFDMVLLSSGLDEVTEAHIRTGMQRLLPGVPVVQHYGGGSGLLYNEIAQTLHHQPKP